METASNPWELAETRVNFQNPVGVTPAPIPGVGVTPAPLPGKRVGPYLL